MITSKGKTQSAFTLTEFLVALGIIIVLASVSVLTFRSIRPSLQLSGAVRSLVTDLRYAQQLAVTEQIDHGVYFSTTTEHKYQIIRYKNGTTTIKEEVLPEGIDFQSFTSQEIKFNPYGAADEAATTTLINTKNKTKTIRVRPSGFVRILD